MTRSLRFTVAGLAGAMSVLSLAAQTPPDFGVQSNVPEQFTKRIVASGLQNPWEVRIGPDKSLWVTERTGKQVVRINPETGTKSILLKLTDALQTVGQDGVLGLALHPALLKTGPDYVYISYVYDADPGPQVRRALRVRRYTYDVKADSLTSPMDVISDLPSHDDHVGGRLAIGPDMKLYLTVGDEGANHLSNACRPNRAQELPASANIVAHEYSSYQGKVLRMNLDGSVPSDNPFLANVRSHIYTYGHRNPQGLVFGPDGKLYESEHGPSTDDEVNLIVAGRNYGWPNVAGYRDDKTYAYANWSQAAPTPCVSLKFDPIVAPPGVPKRKETAWSSNDFMEPMRTFFTVDSTFHFDQGNATIAPSGMAIYSAPAIPNWARSVLQTSLLRGSIFRIRLDQAGTKLVGPTYEYFKSANRYRDVLVNDDGTTIYVAVDTDGSKEDPGTILAFEYKR